MADAVIQRHYMQNVEQLPLIFMNAFDLNVEQRIHADINVELLLYHCNQSFLVCALYSSELFAKRCVIGKRNQALQLTQVLDPTRADARSDEFGQTPVRLIQPAARRDAISNIDDFAGKKPVEVGEYGLASSIRCEFVLPRSPCDCRQWQDAPCGFVLPSASLMMDMRRDIPVSPGYRCITSFKNRRLIS